MAKVAPCIPIVLLSCLICGCAGKVQSDAHQLLAPARMSDDSIVLDLWFIRIPSDDPAHERLWQDVDEHVLPSDLRLRLARNGFRAGVCGPQIPRALQELLQQESATPIEEAARPTDPDGATSDDSDPAAGLPVVGKPQLPETAPQVRHRHLQIRPEMESRVVASDVLERLSTLTNMDGRVKGQTYYNAQAVFTLTAHRWEGGARLELLPEIHHGQARQTYVPIDGGYGLELARPKQSYEKLRLTVDLAAGEMLFLSAMPDRPGSLGYQFFRNSRPAGTQKVLVIRLSQCPDTGISDVFEAKAALSTPLASDLPASGVEE